MTTPSHIATLTIWEPWATFIADGHKKVENRDWTTSFRGPLLIHAGKRWVRRDVDWTIAEVLGDGRLTPNQVPSLDVLKANRGMAIAVTTVVGCRSVHVFDKDPWAVPGGYALELGPVERIEPFAVVGQRKLFGTPVTEAIAEALDRLDQRCR